MIKIYQDNGLPFYDAAWIRDRAYIQQVIADIMTRSLKSANKAWSIHQTEAPCLIPLGYVSKEYNDEDVFRIYNDESTVDFLLKPETTASSYAYARDLLDHQLVTPPLCVWQASKSFRRENDQVSANVRLKEFYQQEFQCIVTDDTKMDYHTLVPEIAKRLEKLLGHPMRVVDSDRLPSYSERTIDIEAKTKHKWLEICSISKRHDIWFTWELNAKPRTLINYEFAFGLDRCVFVNNEGLHE